MPAGRPKGSRNKATKDIKALAQPYAPQAVAELVGIMQHSESDAARVAAAREILDRAYGRAAQPIEHSGQIGIAETLDRVLAVIAQREQTARDEDAVRH